MSRRKQKPKVSDLLASRLSISGAPANTTSCLSSIEAEYIKNLQRQIYFLELEANYLRDAAKKNATSQTYDSQTMLRKLKQMQEDIDMLHKEIKNKEIIMNNMATEQDLVVGKLKSEIDNSARDKRMLIEDIVELRKSTETLGKEKMMKEKLLHEFRMEKDDSVTALRTAQQEFCAIKSQLEREIEQHRITRLRLEEKSQELLKAETAHRELELRYYGSPKSLQNKLVEDLREEICMLHQKNKEIELTSQQDRYLKDKITEENFQMVKENSILIQQTAELQKQLEREKSLRESSNLRYSHNIDELVTLREKEKNLKFELDQAKKEIKQAQEDAKYYQDQLTKQEMLNMNHDRQTNASKSQLMELEMLQKTAESDNKQLRNEKRLLVEHITELQSKLESKDKDIKHLKEHLSNVGGRLHDLEHLKDLENTIQTQKWEEFGKLADTMKTLSESMAQVSTSSNIPVSTY